MILLVLLRMLFHSSIKWDYKEKSCGDKKLIGEFVWRNNELRQKNKDLMVGNERLVLVKKMSVEISSGYKWNYLERTKNNEPVIISYKENDLQGSSYIWQKHVALIQGGFKLKLVPARWKEVIYWAFYKGQKRKSLTWILWFVYVASLVKGRTDKKAT